jgi:hypothetical protein
MQPTRCQRQRRKMARAAADRLSGGVLQVPKTSLERLLLTVKLARLKADYLRRHQGA